MALPQRLPDHLAYERVTGTLHVSEGSFGPVSPRVADYDVANRRVIWRWLNNRTACPDTRTAPAQNLMT